MAEWQHLCESYGRYLSSAHAGRLYDMGIQALQFYNASAWEALWATPSPSWNWGPVPNIEPTSPTNGGVGGTRALAHSIYIIPMISPWNSPSALPASYGEPARDLLSKPGRTWRIFLTMKGLGYLEAWFKNCNKYCNKDYVVRMTW